MTAVLGLALLSLVVLGAGGALIKIGHIVGSRNLPQRHSDQAINYQIHYQAMALLFAGAFVAVLSLFSQQNFVTRGNSDAPARHFGWLGFEADVTWTTVGWTFLILPTLATTIVSFIQVAKSVGLIRGLLPQAVFWAIIFSITNSLTEELIFRVGFAQVAGVGDLATVLPLLSAAVFGGLHYFGTPGKAIGVLMAGFLGWALMWSVVETQGIGWAWAIHFAQDVPILTLILWKSLSQNRRV